MSYHVSTNEQKGHPCLEVWKWRHPAFRTDLSSPNEAVSSSGLGVLFLSSCVRFSVSSWQSLGQTEVLKFKYFKAHIDIKIWRWRGWGFLSLWCQCSWEALTIPIYTGPKSQKALLRLTRTCRKTNSCYRADCWWYTMIVNLQYDLLLNSVWILVIVSIRSDI